MFITLKTGRNKVETDVNVDNIVNVEHPESNSLQLHMTSGGPITVPDMTLEQFRAALSTARHNQVLEEARIRQSVLGTKPAATKPDAAKD